MNMLYSLLLYIHISSVILSIGPFFLLIPLLKKLKTAEDTARNAYLDVFKFAVLLSKHAGHVLVGSGVLLVITGGWTWKTPWIAMTIAILVSSLFFLARAFSPTIRKYEAFEHDKESSLKKLKRIIWVYIGLLMVMLWFMVAKPILW